MSDFFPEQLSASLKSGRNRLEFALRNFLTLPAPAYRETPEPKDDLLSDRPEAFAVAEAFSKPQAFRNRYDLSNLYRTASRQRTLETLSYLEWLDVMARWDSDTIQRAFQTPLPAPANASQGPKSGTIDTKPLGEDRRQQQETLCWLDVGAKNWSYVEALSAFIRARTDAAFRLDGVELDPNRRYTDFRTRRQYAENFIQGVPEAHYHAGSILDWREPANVITHFMPFVLPDPLLAWGLPLKHFQPVVILEHLVSRLQPGGVLLIVNQGEAETATQEQLLAEVAQRFSIRYATFGPLPNSFIPYKYPRYGWMVAHP